MNFYITKVFGFLDKSEKKLFMTIFYIILFDLILILKNKIYFLNNLITIKNIFYEQVKLASAAIFNSSI